MRSVEGKWARNFVLIFIFSGLAGLGYQVIWAKAFAAAIGHEYPAVLAVVTAFMSGMAAGNALLARKSSIHPAWYGWLEIVIGIWGIATVLLIPALQKSVIFLLGVDPPALLHWLVVFLAVLLVLLPATVAMGATLPAAERFAFAILHRNTTGLLYGANTAGATLGALLTAFCIMPWIGIRGSVTALAIVNLTSGVAALIMAYRTTGDAAAATVSGRLPAALAARLFLAGLIGIGFEVVIVRALSHVLENTVYTFASVIAVYLGGNALGAIIFHRAGNARLFRSGSILFPALAIACAAAGILIRWMPGLYRSLRLFLGDSLLAVAMAETVTAAVVLAVPTFFMGATWAALAQESLRLRPNLGMAVAINTLGAALGPILFGMMVIPAFGLKTALASVPVAYALLGGRTRPAVIGFILAAGLAPFGSSARQLIDPEGSKIIHLKEGVMGTVAVLEDESGERVLKLNNRFQMGGTSARIAEARQADIPLLLHPAPKRALFIGLGTGITFATAANYPGLQSDGVELVPEIMDAMPLFNIGDDPKDSSLKSYVADGRRYVLATRQKYDVVVADLFHPGQDGAGFLYTREHFAAIRERLEESGLFCQWLPLHQLDLSTLRIIVRTFNDVFSEGHLWLLRFNIDTPVVGLIGWKNQNSSRAGMVEAKMASDDGIARHLRTVGLTDSIRLFGCYLGPARVGKSVEINTDLDPIVVFRAPAITFARRDDPGKRLLELIQTSGSKDELRLWAGADFQTRMEFIAKTEKFVDARNVYLRGLNAERNGERAEALTAYLESAKLSSDFTAGYAQALTLATAIAQTNPESARTILEALIAAQPERPVARELLERLAR